jgi:hypothetical protein
MEERKRGMGTATKYSSVRNRVSYGTHFRSALAVTWLRPAGDSDKMAVELVNEHTLKRLKNSVIGNAGAKAALAADGTRLQL